MGRKQVVIVGGSFAGLSAARQFAGEPVDVTVIDPSRQFTWTPNIHEILSGVKQRGDVSLSRRKLLAGMGHRFLKGVVTGLDTDAQVIELDSGIKLPFDACVIACGHAQAQSPSAPNQFGFRSSEDIEHIHRAIDERLTAADQATVTIVGGGFSGVEALGELLRSYRYDPRVSLRVVESAPRLMASVPEVVSADIQRLCDPLQVKFYLGQRVAELADNTLTVTDGTTLATDVTIWSAGTRLPAFLRESSLSQDGGDGLPVAKTLRSRHASGIFVAGDAASLAEPLRKQSYHALTMGELAGTNALAWLNNTPLDAYVAEQKPLLLSFGDLTTYLIIDETVLASPLLASMKEAVFQFTMAKLAKPLPWLDQGLGLFSRFNSSVFSLVVPELTQPRLLRYITGSRILQYGGCRDILQLAQATRSTLLSG